MFKLIKNEFVKNFHPIRLLIVIAFIIIVFFVFIESIYIQDSKPTLLNKSTIYKDLLKKYNDDFNNNPSNDNLYFVYFNELNVEIEDIQNSKDIYRKSWHEKVIENIKKVNQEISIIKVINNNNMTFERGMKYKNNTKEELSLKLNEYTNERLKYIDLFKNGSYSDFVSDEILKLNNMPDSNELIKVKQYIVDNKINDELDNRVVIQKKLEEFIQQSNYSNGKAEILSKEDFNHDYLKNYYSTYNLYLDSMNNKQKALDKEYKTLWYALENNIELTNDTKNTVDSFWILYFIFSFAIIILYASVISNEYKSGSIRLLLTQGVKRYKIILSKYISTIISVYLTYLLFLILFIIILLLKGDFNDLLIPKLVSFGGNVIEVNYFIYLLFKILICSLPSMFIITLTLLISTIAKNYVPGVIISIMLTSCFIFQEFILFITFQLKFFFIRYIPITYLIFSPLNIKITDYSDIYYLVFNKNLEIIILTIYIILMYLITHIIFIKRDIKN